MSLFMGPEEHAANPPSTWNVVKVGSRWALRTTPDQTFETYRSRKAAEADKVEGHWTCAYAEDGRWYAGDTPAGWKSWEECKAERDRNARRVQAQSAKALKSMQELAVHPAYADGTYDGPVGPIEPAAQGESADEMTVTHLKVSGVGQGLLGYTAQPLEIGSTVVASNPGGREITGKLLGWEEEDGRNYRPERLAMVEWFGPCPMIVVAGAMVPNGSPRRYVGRFATAAATS